MARPYDNFAGSVPQPGNRPILSLDVALGNGVATDSLPVSTWWEVSYNGVRFGPMTHVTRFAVTPVPDEGRRTIAFNRFEMSLESTVTGSSPLETDNYVTDIVQALTKNGGTLRVFSLTFGEHIVNDPNWGLARDVRMGPWPGPVEIISRGGITCTFTWSVSWEVPYCDDAVYDSTLGFLQNNYTFSYAMDADGYTTRTITGDLVMPQQRRDAGQRFVAAWADSAREYLALKFPYVFSGTAFRRTYPRFETSKDRATLSYTIVDTEMGEAAPPPFCTEAEADIDAESRQEGGLVWWQETLTAKYKLVKNATVQPAVNAFLQLFGEKVQFAINILDGRRPGLSKGIIPYNFSMGCSNLYGKRVARFSVSWGYVSSLKEILERGGLWSPLAERDNWVAWTQSMSDGPMHVRGMAKLGFGDTAVKAGDATVDLCAPQPGLLGDNQVGNVPGGPNDNVIQSNPGLAQLLTPTAARSWLHFEHRVEWDQDDGLSELRTLPVYTLDGTVARGGTFNGGDPDAVGQIMDGAGNPTPAGGGVGSSQLVGGLVPPPAGGGGLFVGNVIDNTVATQPAYDPKGNNWGERRVRPARVIFYTGRAVRYGFEIPEPNLLTIDVTDAATGQISTYKVARACRPDMAEVFVQQAKPVISFPILGVRLPPVVEAVWRLRYVVIGDPPVGPITQPRVPAAG